MARKATSYSFETIYGCQRAFMQRAGVIPVPWWRPALRVAGEVAVLLALGAAGWLVMAAFGGAR